MCEWEEGRGWLEEGRGGWLHADLPWIFGLIVLVWLEVEGGEDEGIRCDFYLWVGLCDAR